MELNKLYALLDDQPKFRVKQAEQAIFLQLIDNWDQALNMPKDLREKLNTELPLTINAEVRQSSDGNSLKALIHLSDNQKIETVLLIHKDGRHTVCVSSQVGCKLGCHFCATGQGGFCRDLTRDEIVEQVLFWNRYLKEKNERVSNIVFMGMGEPFLNYGNVMSAIRLINDPDTFNIGKRNISISTIGVIDGIEQLAKDNPQINLAISLHAPNNNLREQIIPANMAWPIEKILKAVDAYIAKTHRRVMIEYTLLQGINDSEECAKQLAKLMKRPLVFVNLIKYNQTKQFQPSDTETTRHFKDVLEKNRVAVTQRYGFGQDIEAGCGQLAGKVQSPKHKTQGKYKI